MDTPERQVSWLECFPPDIWAYFVWYLPGEQLGRLKMTGATMLWQRLKSIGAVKSIKLGEDFLHFKSFPMFLREFPSLEELSINSGYDEWSDDLGLRLDLLPCGLKKLALRGRSWKQAKLLEPCGLSMLCQHLPHLETLDLFDLYLADYSWLAHCPQSLTRLRIRAWNGDVELPSSLLYFEAWDIEISPQTFVSKLPPSLESFVAQYSVSGIELVSYLPPSTVVLSLGDRAGYSGLWEPSSPQKLLEQLPRLLTQLKVPSSVEIDFKSNPELTSLFPATLTVLKLRLDLPGAAWPLLPHHLTNLSLEVPAPLSTVVSKITDNQGVVHETTSFPFDTLPKSITKLKLRSVHQNEFFCGPPSISSQSYFPSQLTYLQLSGIQLAAQTVKLLPSSLTHLEIENFCEPISGHLPKNLKTLIAITLLSPNLFKDLPKSLTNLQLHLARPYSRWFDYSTGQTIGPLSKLAEYTVHENCLSNSFDWKNSHSLPPTITFFAINQMTELGDSFLNCQPLPNAIKFILGASNLTDLSIPLLSPHLTHLDLKHSKNISGKSFPFLPRGLTFLNLSDSKSIFDADIQHLPRPLKVIFMNRATHLTDLCVADLPPHLEEFYTSSQITPASFAHLPYSLRAYRQFSPAMFSNWHIERGVVKETP